jgi:hypothetical protein
MGEIKGKTIAYNVRMPGTADGLVKTVDIVPGYVPHEVATLYPRHSFADLIRAKLIWRAKENMMRNFFGNTSSSKKSSRRRRSSSRRSRKTRRSSRRSRKSTRRRSRGGSKRRGSRKSRK